MIEDDKIKQRAPQPNEVDQAQLEQAVEAAAAALVQRYGEDAEVIATLRAAEFAAEGDTEALHAWDMIIAQLVAQREGASSLPNATIN
jgi:hypothetical protein